jgi:hypothetical protein
VLQLLLRKQIAALQEVFGFPDELEVCVRLALSAHMCATEHTQLIARDLWACYVSTIDLEPAPLLAAQHDDNERKARPQPTRPPSLESTESLHKRMELDIGSDTESDESDAAPPSQSASASMSVRGHSLSEGVESGVESKPKQRWVTKELDPRKTVHACYTLVIVYLSCVTLRLPVMVNDVIRCVHRGRVSLEASSASA